MLVVFNVGPGAEAVEFKFHLDQIPREGEYVQCDDDHTGYVRSVSWVLNGSDVVNAHVVVKLGHVIPAVPKRRQGA